MTDNEKINARWKQLLQDSFKSQPAEGKTVLVTLKVGAVLRYENVPNLPRNVRAGKRIVLTEPFKVFGYRYCQKRIYFPLYRVSANLLRDVESWEDVEFTTKLYHNGYGRIGEESFLSAED